MSEAVRDRLPRLLALVPWLQAHPGVRLADTAAHFGVTPAQLEQDLWLTVLTGLPGHAPDQLVDIDFWAEDGRIRVHDPQELGRPLRLTPDEAVSLLVALHVLAEVPGGHDRTALASARATLEQAAGEAAAAAAHVRVTVEAGDPGVAEAVARALREQRALWLRYLAPARDEVTERLVDPWGTVVVEGRGYLQAWCRRAADVRLFRLDRVLAAQVRDEPAAPPPDVRPRALDTRTLRPDGPPATLDLAPGSGWVVELLGAEVLADDPAGWTRVRAGVADEAYVVGLLLRLGDRARVVGPPHLVATVAQAARAALAGYDQPFG